MNRKQRRMQRTSPKSKPLKVVFCIPGRSFSNTFLRCWTDLLAWCLQNNIQALLSNAYDSNVYYVRNKILGADDRGGKNQDPFGGQLDYDYIMWIDSDMAFTPEHFKQLLDMKKDIATGIYKTADNIHYATVKDWNLDFFKKEGRFEFLTDEHLQTEEPIFTVEYNGFGWMLIKKGVIESLEYPWFRPLWQEVDSNIHTFTSEDVGFCQKAIEKGYKIYANKNLIIGHEKSWIL